MLEIDVVEVRGRCLVHKVGDKIVVADPRENYCESGFGSSEIRGYCCCL